MYLYKENHLHVNNKFTKNFISAFGIAVAPASTASEAEQVQAQTSEAEQVQAQAPEAEQVQVRFTLQVVSQLVLMPLILTQQAVSQLVLVLHQVILTQHAVSKLVQMLHQLLLA